MWTWLPLAVLIAVAAATSGVDVSQNFYVPAWQCLANEGYSFAIIRAYCSNGEVDSSSVHNIYNAWAGGMQHVDIYMFPCPTCGNPASQVNDMLDYQAQYTTTFGMVWLDIEGEGYWMDRDSNRDFFNGLVAALENRGVHFGVYTNENEWRSIMGLDFYGGSDLPLWYAHWDERETFDDFDSFAGWDTPAMKQNQGDTSSCGMSIDVDWYPDSLEGHLHSLNMTMLAAPKKAIPKL